MLDDYVLRLKIAMNDPMAMYKGNSLVEITQDGEDFMLRDGASLSDELEEMTVWAILHNQVDVFFIAKETIEFHDVRMIQVHLDFHFPHEGYL